jgi:hypothetical protein
VHIEEVGELVGALKARDVALEIEAIARMLYGLRVKVEQSR